MSIDKLNIQNLSQQLKKIDNQVGDLNNKASQSGEAQSFKDLLSDFVGDVNKLQNQADDSVNKLAAGEITDVHDVMVKVEEANLSFSLMMEIRNKIVEGYKEVLKTQV